MPKYGPIACLSPVIKARFGEHKFDRYGTQKTGTWKMEKNWGGGGVLAIQKVAKTGNIGKKTPVAGDIDYVRYLSMQKVNLN